MVIRVFLFLSRRALLCIISALLLILKDSCFQREIGDSYLEFFLTNFYHLVLILLLTLFEEEEDTPLFEEGEGQICPTP